MLILRGVRIPMETSGANVCIFVTVLLPILVPVWLTVRVSGRSVGRVLPMSPAVPKDRQDAAIAGIAICI